MDSPYITFLMEAVHGSGNKFWFDTNNNQFYLFHEDHCDFLEDNADMMNIPQDKIVRGYDYERNYKLAFDQGYVRGGFEDQKTTMYLSCQDPTMMRRAVRIAYEDFHGINRIRMDLIDEDLTAITWNSLKGDDQIRHFVNTGAIKRARFEESKKPSTKK
jgi:hypothetical protein